jgi:hypothetical protein
MARRHESLIPLSHQHHDALLLAWRLRSGDLSKREPELRAGHVSAFFEYRLVSHLKLEEDLLSPAFRAVLGENDDGPQTFLPEMRRGGGGG